jgi:hypothetical protein
MAKVTIELELDEAAYRAKYGPGSEHWNRYRTVDTIRPDGIWDSEPKPESDYKPIEGQALHDAIIEILGEGFYDWDSNGWLKLKIDGKPVRECCATVEGDGHKSYCESIAGPEASEA